MNSVPLSAFLGQVRAVLQGSFSKGVWVTAEVLAISGSPHKYLELVEYDENRVELAKAKGIIWKSSLRILDSFLKATGQPLIPGMSVLARVAPKFHESFGFSLVIEEIDPAYSLGQMQLRIKAITDFLTAKGVINNNRKLPPAGDFFRLAVVSPADAAGLGDFRTEADRIAELGLCSFDYYHAQFQGEGAGDRIVEAMALAVKAHKEVAPYDALVIIRGGGDSAGLFQLNHQRLCHAVCRVPLPVIIGIGHERDRILLDDLANLRLPTPSMVISHIKQRMIENANEAHDAFETLDRAAEKVLTAADEQSAKLLDGLLMHADRLVDSADVLHRQVFENLLEKSDSHISEADRLASKGLERIVEISDRLCDKAAQGAEYLVDSLFTQAAYQLDQAESQAKQLVTEIMAANPLAILKQGYGYVRASDGGFLTRSDQAQSGQQITITLQDGSFDAITTIPQQEQVNV